MMEKRVQQLRKLRRLLLIMDPTICSAFILFIIINCNKLPALSKSYHNSLEAKKYNIAKEIDIERELYKGEEIEEEAYQATTSARIAYFPQIDRIIEGYNLLEQDIETSLDNLDELLDNANQYIENISTICEDTTKTVNLMNEINAMLPPISIEKKMEVILTHFELSESQFKVIAGVTLAESKNGGEGENNEDSIEDVIDTLCVINVIYNRLKSEKWKNTVANRTGSSGENLYNQVICPGQFTTYHSGMYRRYQDATESKGYKAIINFLYCMAIGIEEVNLHHYLAFRSSNCKIKEGKYQFIEGGNYYFDELILEEEKCDTPEIEIDKIMTKLR